MATICDIYELFDMHNIKCPREEIDDIVNNSDLLKESFANGKSMIIQKGGDSINYMYGINIQFYVTKTDTSVTYTLFNNNVDGNTSELCLMINVPGVPGDKNQLEKFIGKLRDPNRPYRYAELSAIGNYGKCMSRSNSYIFDGTKLLDIAISFIKSIKNKYYIDRIILKDNAYKTCFNQGKTRGSKLKLSILNILLHGHTWYGRHGFKPLPEKNESYDMIQKKNTKIIL